jgi:hypothetical protein
VAPRDEEATMATLVSATKLAALRKELDEQVAYLLDNPKMLLLLTVYRHPFVPMKYRPFADQLLTPEEKAI